MALLSEFRDDPGFGWGWICAGCALAAESLKAAEVSSCPLVAAGQEICAVPAGHRALGLQLLLWAPDIRVVPLLWDILVPGVPEPCRECTWRSRVRKEMCTSPWPGWWPWEPGGHSSGDWGAPVGTGLGCPSLQAQAVKTPSRASVPAQFPHFCGWAQFWCLQTSLWDTTGSSPHSQCGATWKLHFMWKWTLLPQTQLKYSLCHF